MRTNNSSRQSKNLKGLWSIKRSMVDVIFISEVRISISFNFYFTIYALEKVNMDTNRPPLFSRRLTERSREEIFLSDFPCCCVSAKLCEIPSILAPSTEDYTCRIGLRCGIGYDRDCGNGACQNFRLLRRVECPELETSLIHG